MRRPRGHQTGTTLIEVLVALVLLSVALFGTLALQVKLQHTGLDTYQRGQALILAEDMVNRMFANRTEADRGYYMTTELAQLPGKWEGGYAPDLPYPDSVAAKDLAAWNRALRGENELRVSDASAAGGLINAIGCIDRDLLDSNLWYVSVAWQGTSESALPQTALACGVDYYENADLRRILTLPVKVFD